MTDDELRAWASAFDGHSCSGFGDWVIAAAVIRLLDENAALRKQVEGHCERIAAQSELLSRRAEFFHHDEAVHGMACTPGKFYGSTGMSSTIAGRKSSGAGA